MLKKKLNYTTLIITFILSESFWAITTHFELYTLRQLGGEVMFSIMGVYAFITKLLLPI
jgi:hypothetical protein